MSQLIVCGEQNFNPRPREEGDYSYWRAKNDGINFNPRPREEGDFPITPLQANRSYFNPRPREEGDKTMTLSSTHDTISIHALVKRATKHPDFTELLKIFQSTPS